MPLNQCPRCGCPLDELCPESTHRVSEGRTAYRRCVCGKWLVEVNGKVVGAAGIMSS
ncbi:MAG TPA: hypothetical protein VHC18_17805 [Amycolatopsis sp.]|nr:hypothetical protein [Amycolatopsis sp.]